MNSARRGLIRWHGCCLESPLAFHKAILSHTAIWIGVSLEITRDEVIVEVTEAKVTELLQLIYDALAGNVIPSKKLHTLVGKCMSIASVLYAWRPSLYTGSVCCSSWTQEGTGQLCLDQTGQAHLAMAAGVSAGGNLVAFAGFITFKWQSANRLGSFTVWYGCFLDH